MDVAHGIGGRVGEIRQPIIKVNPACSLEDRLLYDQGIQQIVEQQLGRHAGTDGFFMEQLDQPADTVGPLHHGFINQGQGNRTAAATQPLTHQHLVQSQATSSRDPHLQVNFSEDEEARRRHDRKKEIDRSYRKREKDKRQALLDENSKLKQEIQEKEQQMKSKTEALETANGRLTHENKVLKSKTEELEDENGRLKREIEEREQRRIENIEAQLRRIIDDSESVKAKNVSLNLMLETKSRELAELQNQFAELKQQIGTTKKRRISSTGEEDAISVESTESRPKPKFLSRVFRGFKTLRFSKKVPLGSKCWKV